MIPSPTFRFSHMEPVDDVWVSDYNFFHFCRTLKPTHEFLNVPRFLKFSTPKSAHHFLWGSRVFQQYVVEWFCEAASERLQYLRQNRASLRAADYTSICGHLGDPQYTKDNVDTVQAFRLFVLPSAYAGGD